MSKEGITNALRHRLAIRYAINGDLRFLSHHDTLRLFHRAIARAGLPIRHSEGFNPRPRVSIVMPRPVGVASDDERLVIELTEPISPDDVSSRLAAQMPEGIRILDAVRLGLQDRVVPLKVEYIVPLQQADAATVGRACSDLMAKPSFIVERSSPTGRGSRMIDIRVFLIEMRASDGMLVWSQTVSQDGTARVNEVLDAVGLPSGHWTHRVIRRTATFRE